METQNIKIIAAVCCLLAIVLCGADGFGNILVTKHNLSASGPGTVTATEEDRVCIFCHTPHHATSVAPLWSRSLSNSIYNLYGSSTLVAQPGQPTGASRLCLSCHDGTIAIGMIQGMDASISLMGGITVMPSGLSNLETDLSDDHPISFVYDSVLAGQRGELKDPLSLPSEIKLEDGKLLQCTSCHNPHKDPHGMFLVMSNSSSALCVSCHDKTGWEGSSHATNIAIAEQGCQNCHQPHGAPGAKHLLQSEVEEGTCLTNCHNGVGEGGNIQSSTSKFYRHPMNYANGVHDVTEVPMSMAKHVECADCHNPHRVNQQSAPLSAPPHISGRLAGVSGVSNLNTILPEASYEYEVCFKCHSQNSFVGTEQIIRLVHDTDERNRFDGVSGSYHPVTRDASGSVPGLKLDYQFVTRIYCTDCHGDSDSIKAGGVGANGPHGSAYQYILIDQYVTDQGPYSSSNYALCFRCHEETALFDPASSNFSYGLRNSHQTHVIGKNITCSACHDPHGVSAAAGGTSLGNAHLINFDSRYVDPVGVYNSIERSCTVSCHKRNGGTHSY